MMQPKLAKDCTQRDIDAAVNQHVCDAVSLMLNAEQALIGRQVVRLDDALRGQVCVVEGVTLSFSDGQRPRMYVTAPVDQSTSAGWLDACSRRELTLRDAVARIDANATPLALGQDCTLLDLVDA